MHEDQVGRRRNAQNRLDHRYSDLRGWKRLLTCFVYARRPPKLRPIVAPVATSDTGAAGYPITGYRSSSGQAERARFLHERWHLP